VNVKIKLERFVL